MHIETLTIEEYNSYERNHPLTSFYQTINYGMLKAENNYDYELIGLKDNNNHILGSSLILIKEIGSQSYYGYAPRGFLIDYNNEELLNTFVTELKKYYEPKKVIFIKINPNLPIGEINTQNFNITYNENYNIKNKLINCGCKKLADNMYFEAKLPRFNAFIDLKKFTEGNINKNHRNKIRKGSRKGLVFEQASKNELSNFYELLKDKINKDEFYYQDYYTVFEKEKAIDLFLVSINYEEFLQNSQYIYNIELDKNNYLNEKLINYNSEKNINAKMSSDKTLLSYKNDILEASKYISEGKEKVYIAGALVVKNNNIATIIMTAFDKNYKRFAPNYFLYYNIIKYYQNSCSYLDLNGVVGDFKGENPYSGLNRFKLGFKPRVFEYIGEYDLIINQKIYDTLLYNGYLRKEFANKNEKN